MLTSRSHACPRTWTSSPRGAEFAEELLAELSRRFQITVLIRTVADCLGHQLYQIRKPKDRYLVDVRGVSQLPPHGIVQGVQVVDPIDLICQKVISMVGRSRSAKGTFDLGDL